jgi:hypothetical protein
VNRDQKVALGAACIVTGSWLLYTAYEGRKTPFWVKLLPGA